MSRRSRSSRRAPRSAAAILDDLDAAVDEEASGGLSAFSGLTISATPLPSVSSSARRAAAPRSRPLARAGTPRAPGGSRATARTNTSVSGGYVDVSAPPGALRSPRALPASVGGGLSRGPRSTVSAPSPGSGYTFTGACRPASKPIPLRRVVVGAEVCLAFVGSGRHKFCVAQRARGERTCPLHRGARGKRFSLTETSYHIPGQTVTGGGPNVFVVPRIAEAHLLEKFRRDAKRGVHTTPEWAARIDQWNEEFDAAASDPSEGGGEGEETGDGAGSLGSAGGGGSVKSESSKSAPARLSRAPVDEIPYSPGEGAVIPKFEDGTVSFDVEGTVNEGPLKDMVTAIATLYAAVEGMSSAAPAEGVRVASAVSRRMTELAGVVNGIADALEEVKAALGDWEVCEGHETMAAAIEHTLLAGAVSPGEEGEDVRGEIHDLEAMIETVARDSEGDLASVTERIVERLAALDQRINEVEDGQGFELEGYPGPGGAFQATTRHPQGGGALEGGQLVLDESGSTLGTVGELFQLVGSLQERVEAAEGTVKRLQDDVTSQGGIVLEKRSYTSMEAVRQMVLREDPEGKSLAAFVCFPSIFAHDESFAPSKEWVTLTKPMRASGDYTDAEARFVTVVTQNYCALYTAGNAPQADKTLPVFDTETRWTTPMTGERDKIESALERSVSSLRTYRDLKLPSNGDLYQLSTDMERVTSRWVDSFHKHLDKDLQELTQVIKLKVADVLSLLSEYFVIISDLIAKKLQYGMRFSVNCDKVEFLTSTIWTALRVHQEMATFVAGSTMRNNPVLGLAFSRFLTKGLAKGGMASYATRIKSLEDNLANVNREQAAKGKIVEETKKALATLKGKMEAKGRT